MDDRGDRPLLGQLGSEFDELGALLLESSDTPLSADRVTRFVAGALPHSEHSALTVIHANGRPETVTSTSDLPASVDQLQHELREGPCLAAAEQGGVIKVADLGSDPRWPVFGPRCVEHTGVQSMLCVHLVMEGEERAALNFYAKQADAFDERDVGVAAIFAPFAAVALQSQVNRRHAEQLEAALASSRQIGTAIGILMARELVTSDEAFAQLRDASQHLNRKLRDIAAIVAETGELPRLDR